MPHPHGLATAAIICSNKIKIKIKNVDHFGPVESDVASDAEFLCLVVARYGGYQVGQEREGTDRNSETCAGYSSESPAVEVPDWESSSA